MESLQLLFRVIPAGVDILGDQHLFLMMRVYIGARSISIHAMRLFVCKFALYTCAEAYG